jgi:hypothetical protein
MLLRQTAELAPSDDSRRFGEQAAETEARLQTIRDLVMDSKFLGHDDKA